MTARRLPSTSACSTTSSWIRRAGCTRSISTTSVPSRTGRTGTTSTGTAGKPVPGGDLVVDGKLVDPKTEPGAVFADPQLKNPTADGHQLERVGGPLPTDREIHGAEGPRQQDRGRPAVSRGVRRHRGPPAAARQGLGHRPVRAHGEIAMRLRLLLPLLLARAPADDRRRVRAGLVPGAEDRGAGRQRWERRDHQRPLATSTGRVDPSAARRRDSDARRASITEGVWLTGQAGLPQGARHRARL